MVSQATPLVLIYIVVLNTQYTLLTATDSESQGGQGQVQGRKEGTGETY